MIALALCLNLFVGFCVRDPHETEAVKRIEYRCAVLDSKPSVVCVHGVEVAALESLCEDDAIVTNLVKNVRAS